MSGIVGVFNRDGGPIDQSLLEEMTSYLRFRGPDAQDRWTDNTVGFGHSLLGTTWESAKEKQPCTLDNQVWITADARIDCRKELIERLQAVGRRPAGDVTDPELILHAYHAWNEQCLDRMMGDFAFAIWDGRRQHLFCARDHFGIKLFYYSLAGGNFLFSNTLQSIRLSRSVSGKLNDAAVADFLVFGNNQNPATTTFSDIQRLPPGHYLVCSKDQFQVQRYWSLPVEDPIFYRRNDEYVEHFQQLLYRVVGDRLRTNAVGVFCSGGLDSSSMAATAQEILSANSSYDLRAYTIVYDQLIPDDERHFAGLVADALRIPIHFLAADRYTLYERWDCPELHTPQPRHIPTSAMEFDQMSDISAHCRVALFGEGPDNALYYEWQPYVSHLIRTLQWTRLLHDLYWHFRAHGEVPFLGRLGKRRSLRKPAAPPDRSWIRPEVLKLATCEADKSARIHRVHPIAHWWMTGSLWEAMFEGYDSESTRFPVEIRHPYMDIRMVQYLLRLPRIPWCRDKYIVRRAFRGRLPDAVLRRPKTSLQQDPHLERFKVTGLPPWTPVPALEKYVDLEMVKLALTKDIDTAYAVLPAISLNYFLAST